jgi:hypothetical protein
MPVDKGSHRERNVGLFIAAVVAAPFVLGFLFVIVAFLWPSAR